MLRSTVASVPTITIAASALARGTGRAFAGVVGLRSASSRPGDLFDALCMGIGCGLAGWCFRSFRAATTVAATTALLPTRLVASVDGWPFGGVHGCGLGGRQFVGLPVPWTALAVVAVVGALAAPRFAAASFVTAILAALPFGAGLAAAFAANLAWTTLAAFTLATPLFAATAAATSATPSIRAFFACLGLRRLRDRAADRCGRRWR